MAGKGKKSRPATVESPADGNQVKRLCLFCKREPAKILDLLHSQGKETPLFCCVTCAATWSIRELSKPSFFLQEYSVSSAVAGELDQAEPKEVPSGN